MKYLRQFAIILGVTCVGELIKYFVPLPIPASIYGLVLMLVLLMSGVLKLGQVKEAGEFLVEIMPLMFIPAGVGLLTSWEQLQGVLVPGVGRTVVTTFVVMIVAGKVSDLFINMKKDSHDKEATE